MSAHRLFILLMLKIITYIQFIWCSLDKHLCIFVIGYTFSASVHVRSWAIINLCQISPKYGWRFNRIWSNWCKTRLRKIWWEVIPKLVGSYTKTSGKLHQSLWKVTPKLVESHPKIYERYTKIPIFCDTLHIFC